MNKLLSVFLVTLLGFGVANAQVSRNFYSAFDAKGKKVDLEKILIAAADADVVFLGETHDDSVAHALQFEIFGRIYEKAKQSKSIKLSLEMFDRDVQVIVDEYLNSLITEKHFLAGSRPWGNYKTDYRPLVEFAKQNKLNVIAANAPRRYVNMVSRGGRESLRKLSPETKQWLPPLPYGLPSPKYTNKFNAMMGGHGSKNILESLLR